MSGRLTISLASLATNYEVLRRAAGTEVAGVVKANAYGFGADAVARRLWRSGCRAYFVATAAEGAELRGVVPEATIYVLEGALASTRAVLSNHRLVPVLNSAAQFEAWKAVGGPAAVHVDSGMERLGLTAARAAELLTQATFEVVLLVSHFARADEPAHAFNGLQLSRMRALQALCVGGGAARISLSNSAAMLSGLAASIDQLGRAGIGLYGGNPFHDQANPMHPVAALEGMVLQVRELSPGTPVGYGGAFETRRPSQLATIGLGYADGVPRLLSDRGQVYVMGEMRPIVGRISMDLLHVDVTGLDVAEGDWVEVFGSHRLIDDVAADASTLAYEIFTGLGARLTRSYIDTPIT